MTFTSVEEALGEHGYDGQGFRKPLSALKEKLLDAEGIASAALATFGTWDSSGDPVGICAVTDRRFLAAYKPEGMMARVQSIERGVQGLYGVNPAKAGEMPAVLIYHDNGELFVSCGPGRDDVRDALLDSLRSLLRQHIRTFVARPDVDTWVQGLGSEDVQHIMGSSGFATTAKAFPESEAVWAVMPAHALTRPGAFVMTENRMFFQPSDGNVDLLLNVWPGGLETFRCEIGQGQVSVALVPGDPEQLLAGTDMKEEGIGYDHAGPVEVQLGVDTPRETLGKCEELLKTFLGLPPSPK